MEFSHQKQLMVFTGIKRQNASSVVHDRSSFHWLDILDYCYCFDIFDYSSNFKLLLPFCLTCGISSKCFRERLCMSKAFYFMIPWNRNIPHLSFIFFLPRFGNLFGISISVSFRLYSVKWFRVVDPIFLSISNLLSRLSVISLSAWSRLDLLAYIRFSCLEWAIKII